MTPDEGTLLIQRTLLMESDYLGRRSTADKTSRHVQPPVHSPQQQQHNLPLPEEGLAICSVLA